MQLNKEHVEHGRPSTAKNKERNKVQKEACTKAPLTITFDISGSSIHLLLLFISNHHLLNALYEQCTYYILNIH